jgi:3,4-dihydroxy 2-butanone 4-phosphate synthase/GTP cyclohydrolase II
MAESSYQEIMKAGIEEHRACPLKWNCEACTKTLCVRLVAIADFPTVYGDFRILGFTNNKDGRDRLMVVKGLVVGRDSVLTRVHSSCTTGDALGSLRCDCGPQLHRSMEMMEDEGLGALVYMQQEGRGIGLTNKLRAYMLQDGGLDTYDANVELGFKPDERDYEVTSAMLGKVGIKSIRLLTNNPDKAEQLRAYGTTIDSVVHLELLPNPANLRYFEAKRDRFGHRLTLNGEPARDACGCNQ